MMFMALKMKTSRMRAKNVGRRPRYAKTSVSTVINCQRRGLFTDSLYVMLSRRWRRIALFRDVFVDWKRLTAKKLISCNEETTHKKNVKLCKIMIIEKERNIYEYVSYVSYCSILFDKNGILHQWLRIVFISW